MSAGTRIDRSLGAIGSGATAFATSLSVVATFAVSHLTLAALGLEYETPGGTPFEKIHPATYLAVLATLLLVVNRLDPIALLDELVRDHKGLLVFVAAWVALLLHITFVQRTPFTAIVDTFLLPMLLLLLVPRLREAVRRRVAVVAHLFMAANALLGLAEFALGFRLTPLVAGGIELTGDWRSSALLGHPLANAAATGAYVLVLMLGGGRDLPGPLRAIVFALQIPALGVFGGRAALVILGLFGLVILGRQLSGVLAGRRISLMEAAVVAVIVPAGLTAVLIVLDAGFFDRFFERFVQDDGSAQARYSMFVLIGQISWRELLIGPDPDLVATLQRLEGIEFGIESFWVAMIAFYGILVSVPFFVGFLAFLYDLWRHTRPEAIWVTVYFLTVASTSASLSGKTTMLAIVVALVLLMLPALRRPEAS